MLWANVKVRKRESCGQIFPDTISFYKSNLFTVLKRATDNSICRQKVTEKVQMLVHLFKGKTVAVFLKYTVDELVITKMQFVCAKNPNY